MKTTKKTTETSAIAEMQVTFVPSKTGIKIQDSSQAYKFFMSIWDQQLINLQEQCYVIFLNQHCELIGWRLINTGTMTSSTIDIKMILSLALSCKAESIIIAHNHPSGNITESHADIETFIKLKSACKILQIKLNDCLIISNVLYKSIIDLLVDVNPEKKIITKYSPAMLELIDIIQGDTISDYIENVYDEAFVIDSHDINDELKVSLWFVKKLYKLIRVIEQEKTA